MLHQKSSFPLTPPKKNACRPFHAVDIFAVQRFAAQYVSKRVGTPRRFVPYT
jgi:hypothetical protein